MRYYYVKDIVSSKFVFNKMINRNNLTIFYRDLVTLHLGNEEQP